jgi:hypothetical protein
VGHGLTALLTGANSGVLTTVAWSSIFDSRLVQSGGTLANLAAGLLFWVALCSVQAVSMPTRYFLLLSAASVPHSTGLPALDISFSRALLILGIGQP